MILFGVILQPKAKNDKLADKFEMLRWVLCLFLLMKWKLMKKYVDNPVEIKL